MTKIRVDRSDHSGQPVMLAAPATGSPYSGPSGNQPNGSGHAAGASSHSTPGDGGLIGGSIGQPAFVECPLSGEIVAADDIDGLVDIFEVLKAKSDAAYSTMLVIRRMLADRCEGDAITRRVAGARRVAKVTLSDVSFEQSILKELWNSHPDLAKVHMKIASLSVAMREYGKLANTSSSQPDFVFFRDAMTKSCRGRVGTPTVSVEK